MIYTVCVYIYILYIYIYTRSCKAREPIHIVHSMVSQDVSIVAHEVCEEAQEVSIVSCKTREPHLESPLREINIYKLKKTPLLMVKHLMLL